MRRSEPRGGGHTLDQAQIQAKIDKLVTPEQAEAEKELDDMRLVASAREMCDGYLVVEPMLRDPERSRCPTLKLADLVMLKPCLCSCAATAIFLLRVSIPGLYRRQLLKGDIGISKVLPSRSL